MKKCVIFLAFVTLVGVLSQPACAETLQVGPGKPFARPCDAISSANAGDTIEIDSHATYSGESCAWTTDGLTIRGVGGARAHVDGGRQNSRSNAIWVIAGRNTTIENIEFSGASATNHNGAGIRQQGDNLTVRNSYFHDNEDGILVDSSPTSNILIEFSEFGHNGFGDGQSHNIYIGSVAQLIFRYNYSHHANVGHLLKSRAARNVIVYNRLSDESTGKSTYQIDLPNGGLSYLIGNVIEHGPANPNSTFVSYLEEGPAGNLSTQLYAVNNTFVNDGASGTFIRLATASAPAVIKNNVFAGSGSITNQFAAQLTNNFAGDPGFTNTAAQAYHLTAGSPAIDSAADPGFDRDFSLWPEYQYVHPACAERRTVAGALDIGAFESNGNGTPVAGSPCGAVAPVSASAPDTASSPVVTQMSTRSAVVTSASTAAATQPSGLVAAYAFNEGSGTAVHDLSGNNNNGTIANAAWNASGRYGAALSFNGSNSLVTVPETASLDLTTALTLEAWVKPTAAPQGFQAILFKEMPGDTAYYLYRSGYSAAPLGGVYVGAEQSLPGGSGLALNTWSHLAFTYNGAVEQLYVNGTLVASRNQTGAAKTSTGVLHIGGNSVWGEYFLGSIDEVRIYNRALSVAEIQTDMNTALASGPTDTTAPSVAITSPASGTSLTGTVTITASASDDVGVAGVQFQLDGVNLGAEVTASPYSTSWNTAASSRGSHTLTAIARDAAGNKTTSAAVTGNLPDTTAPSVAITSPAGGASLNGTITITASASDNVGVVGVQFQLDGVNLGTEVTASPYSTSWNTAASSRGSHTLTAIARDAAGNKATSVAVTVNLPDTTAPSVAITSPASGASLNGTGTITASASDNVGVVGVQFQLDGVNLGAEVTASPYSTTWNTAASSRGSHTLTAIARDAAGNKTTSVAVTVNLPDTTAPSVAITSPASGASLNGTATITASASDNVGVVGVQFQLDGANLGTEVTASPYSTTWNTAASSRGFHTLTAIARDAAGNKTTSAAVTVNLPDTTAPSVAITSPASGASLNGTVTITASASDNVGVVGVQFQLDGAKLGAEITASPYSINWDTTKTADGSHTLTAVARDAAGNTSTSIGVSVTTANAPANLVLLIQDSGAGNIISFHLDVTPVSITDSNGVTTALVSGSLPLELTHLDLAPTLAIPATSLRSGSYASINLTVANPQLVVLSGGIPVPVANPTLTKTSISVPLGSMNLVAGSTQGLALDFDIPNSVSVDASGNYTITPVVHPVVAAPANPGSMQDVVGQIVNLPAASPNAFDFQVPKVTGTTRIVTDANTVFDGGITQFTDLRANQFVEIAGVLQGDGTFLAKYVELSAADQALRIQGLVTGVQQDAQNRVNAVNVVSQN